VGIVHHQVRFEEYGPEERDLKENDFTPLERRFIMGGRPVDGGTSE